MKHTIQGLAAAFFMLYAVSANTAIIRAETLFNSGFCNTTGDSQQASAGSVLAQISCNNVANNRVTDATSTARAEFGSLGVSNFAELSIISAPPPSGSFLQGGRTVSSLLDNLSIVNGPSDGLVRFFFDIEGTVNFDVPTTAQFGVPDSLVFFRVNANTIFQDFVRFPTGTGQYNQSFSENLSIDLPFAGAALTLDVSLVGDYNCGGINASGRTPGSIPCLLQEDFLTSAIFTGAQVFDQALTPLPNADIVADSGFDYRAGFNQTGSIPEPATLALMGLGLAGLGFARRRRLHE